MLIEPAIKKCMVLHHFSHLVYYRLNALGTKFPEGIKSTSYMKRINDSLINSSQTFYYHGSADKTLVYGGSCKIGRKKSFR